MKVLFISSFHPYAAGEIGAGEAICGESLDAFLNNGYNVDVCVISPKRQRANEAIVGKCNSYITYSVVFFNMLLSVVHNLFKGALVAPWFFTRVQKDALQYINAMIERNHYDFIWLDFPSSLGFAALIEHPDIRYCAHDVVAQRMERSVVKKWISGYVRKIEASLFKKLSHISVLSNKDLDLIKDMGFCGNTSIIILGSQKVGVVDDAVSVETIVNDFCGKTNIIFFGNMRRSENHWSIMWFILFVFLRLFYKNRRIHLWVMGICPRLSLRLFSKLIPNVHVVGAVDDPSLAFQKAELCIAPLLFGAGVKIKVIQMLDSGATVMATPVGAEGVDSNKRLIIVDPKYLYNALYRYWNS
ncbi:glycosyltransferase [Tolumonas lignilytica]|uniref:glycosyltransferase n=1 Tax=Tolumonas lignilytica TaxID=1283284 RepID=UPI000463AA14|nr:glycosyltransferase family 4 protein [Tolumonas lignilytica]